MEKEITVKQDAAPPSIATARWGAVESIDTSDLLVPKIYHQQALSKFAADGLARPGDFCDSLSGEVLGTKEKGLQVIVFGEYKTMIIEQAHGDRFELKEIVHVTPENAAYWASAPLLLDTPGGRLRHNLTYNFYCLLPSKVSELPFVLSLGSTKTKVARKLNTMLSKLDQIKRAGASKVFLLESTVEKNERGQWYGLSVTQGRDSTEAELNTAYEWYVKGKTQKIMAAEEPKSEASDIEGDDIPF